MANLAAVSEIIACTGVGFSTLYLSWKSSRLRKWVTISPSREDDLTRAFQAKFGYNEHSFVGLSVQSETWIDKENRGAVSYCENGKVWVVAGEPLASDEDLKEITERFIQFARSKRKIVAFLPVTEKFAEIVAGANLRIIKVGAAPYFDLQKWNPKGNPAKKLRSGVNRGRRAGLSVEEILVIDEEFRREAAAICGEWASGRRAGVSFGWLFSLIPFQNSEAKKYYAARDIFGKLAGVLAASPIPARNGWYLEDVLRRSGAPEGTSDLLVFEALKLLSAQGAAIATLGTVPLSNKGTEALTVGRSYCVKKALLFSRNHLSRLYNFEGLGRFKSKFVPSWWENEYVVVSKGHIMPPRVVKAILHVILPGGVLQALSILLSDVWN